MKIDADVVKREYMKVDVSEATIVDAMVNIIITDLRKNEENNTIHNECFLEGGKIREWDGDHHSDWKTTTIETPSPEVLQAFEVIKYLRRLLHKK